MSQARYGFTLTLLPDGRVLAAGGCCGSDGFPVSSAEVYDPSTDAWTTGAFIIAFRS